MEFRYLKAFMAVAHHKNFTLAGEELNIAQSAVSRQIRLLEDSLGQQLLVRSPQSVILTPAGQALHTHSQGFENWTKAFFEGSSQEIRIGVMSGVVDSWLIPKISQLKQDRLPNLSLKIQNEKDIKRDLEKGDLDMGLLVEPIETESITSRTLFKESYVLVSKKEVSMNQLHKERWIFGSSGSFLKKVSKKVSPRFIRVNSVDSIIQLVRKGMGVAIVPKQLIKQNKGLKVYPMKSIGEGKVYLALPNYRVMPETIETFFNHLSKD